MKKKNLIHICPFDRNVGDNALNIAIDNMLSEYFNIDHFELVGSNYGIETFNKFNQYDGIIFGGGGVIHSCSGGSSRKNRDRTGTMWNMDLELIEKLEAKIILYSTGYNRFGGEPEPLERMGEFFDVLNSKRALVSFRNDESLERYWEYFPRHKGILRTPDPGLFLRDCSDKITGDYCLLQIAVDRLDFRYPDGIDSFLELIKELREISPVPFYLIPHTAADLKVYNKLRGKLPVDEIFGDLTAKEDTMKCMSLYRNALFTISTRGHSQICSIGNGTPTFAMCTHPKAMGFMIEVGQDECAYDYHNESKENCLRKFRQFLNDLQSNRKKISTYLAEADNIINDFNNKIVEYMYGNWLPVELTTDPNAQPTKFAASFEAPVENKNQDVVISTPAKVSNTNVKEKEANLQKEIRPKSSDIAYLPGQNQSVKEGTYRGGIRVTNDNSSIIEEEMMKKVNFLKKLKCRKKYFDKSKNHCGIVVSCDKNYFKGVLTCLAAIRRYNPNIEVTFLDAGVTRKQRELARQIFDDTLIIEELENINVKTFPSHLSTAALSSLFCHKAAYKKTLYLDVDALVIGDLSFMFESLEKNVDIVGVRGNNFGWMRNGKLHDLEAELDQASKKFLMKRFPQIKTTSPAINSGCFAIWKEVSIRNYAKAKELIPFLGLFKTADQAILNIIISLNRLNLALVNHKYNMMGFQIGKENILQKEGSRIRFLNGECKFTFNDEEPIVIHFAGRSKPWNIHNNQPSSICWDWHSTTNESEKREIEFRYLTSIVLSEKEFMKISEEYINGCNKNNEKIKAIEQVVNKSREKGYYSTTWKYIKLGQRLKPNMGVFIRQELVETVKAGYMHETHYNYEMGMNKTGKPNKFEGIVRPLIRGKNIDKKTPQITLEQKLCLEARGLKGEKESSTCIGEISIKKWTSSQSKKGEVISYVADKVGLTQGQKLELIIDQYEKGATYYKSKIKEESLVLAKSRIDSLQDFIDDELRTVVQIYGGNNLFLKLFARKYNLKVIDLPLNLDQHGPNDFINSGHPIENKADVIILSNVADKVRNPLELISELRPYLTENGYILFTQSLYNDMKYDVWDGLVLEKTKSNILGLLNKKYKNHLDIKISSISNGEVLILTKLKIQSYKMDKEVDPNGLQNYFYSNDLCQKRIEERDNNAEMLDIARKGSTRSNLNLINLDYQIRFSLGLRKVEPIPEAPKLKLSSITNSAKRQVVIGETKWKKYNEDVYYLGAEVTIPNNILRKYEIEIVEQRILKASTKRLIGTNNWQILDNLDNAQLLIVDKSFFREGTTKSLEWRQNLLSQKILRTNSIFYYQVSFWEILGAIQLNNSEKIKMRVKDVLSTCKAIGLRDLAEYRYIKNLITDNDSQKIRFTPLMLGCYEVDNPEVSLSPSSTEVEKTNKVLLDCTHITSEEYSFEELCNLTRIIKTLKRSNIQVDILIKTETATIVAKLLKSAKQVGVRTIKNQDTISDYANILKNTGVVITNNANICSLCNGVGTSSILITSKDFNDSLVYPSNKYIIQINDTEWVSKLINSVQVCLINNEAIRYEIRSDHGNIWKSADYNANFVRSFNKEVDV